MATKTILGKYQIIKFKPATSSALLQQNGMSQYPSYYIQPIYDKEKQQEMFKTGEAQKLVHVPTRAALVNQTTLVYHDDLINLFINYTMKGGKKILARSIVEKGLEKVKRIQLEKFHKAQTEEEKSKIELNPRSIFHQAIVNCKPILQLTPIKRGGVKYQVPVPITDKRAQFISMKWLLEAAKDKERTVHFPEKLAYELIDAANHVGRVIKKKQDLHKQCEANRAYAHYRWS